MEYKFVYIVIVKSRDHGYLCLSLCCPTLQAYHLYSRYDYRQLSGKILDRINPIMQEQYNTIDAPDVYTLWTLGILN